MSLRVECSDRAVCCLDCSGEFAGKTVVVLEEHRASAGLLEPSAGMDGLSANILGT